LLDLDILVFGGELGGQGFDFLGDGVEAGGVAVGEYEAGDAIFGQSEGGCAADSLILSQIHIFTVKGIFENRLGEEVPEPAPVRKAVPFNNVAAIVFNLSHAIEA